MACFPAIPQLRLDTAALKLVPCVDVTEARNALAHRSMMTPNLGAFLAARRSQDRAHFFAVVQFATSAATPGLLAAAAIIIVT